jgi:hypothetical protein
MFEEIDQLIADFRLADDPSEIKDQKSADDRARCRVEE